MKALTVEGGGAMAAKKKAVKKAKAAPQLQRKILNLDELRDRIRTKQCGGLDDTSGWQSCMEAWRDAFDEELCIYHKARHEFRQDPNINREMPPLCLRDWAMVMWVWARRVRRDILALELQLDGLAALGHHGPVAFFHDPGDPPPPPDEDGLF
jgi:hypothetical protein